MLSSVRFPSLALLLLMSSLKTTATATPMWDVDPAERQEHLLLSNRPAADTVQLLAPGDSSLVDPCIKWSDCSSCLTSKEGISNKCRWSQVTFECTQTGASPDKVADSNACALMAQMQQAFPQTTDGSGKVTKKAGVVPKEYLDSFAAIQSHVFDGEKTDPNSGRHLLSTFLAVHAGAQPTSSNVNNHLQQFSTGASNVKTVWVDNPGLYTRLDIQNICVTAAKLLTNGKDQGGTIGVVVQSHFSFPACITYATFQGKPASCFPIGVFGPPPPGQKGAKVGELCVGSVPL